MTRQYSSIPVLVLLLLAFPALAQVVINEGSNRNFTTLTDADGDRPDWVELYNAGQAAVDLAGYSISDDAAEPAKWIFPSVVLPAQSFLLIHCSGKDRTAQAGLTLVGSYPAFAPVAGWNLHAFATAFPWDGTSDLLIDINAYTATGFTLNSIFRQMTTPLPSTAFVYADDPEIRDQRFGNLSRRRPVMRLNGVTIGTEDWLNSVTEFPAPYSNRYSGAKHELLIHASELTAAGLTAGDITDLAFDVITPNPGTYDQLEIRMTQVQATSISAAFPPVNASNELHTNFKISRGGETVGLYSPTQVLLSSLAIEQEIMDQSNGTKPDGSATDSLFAVPTPGASNNASAAYDGYAVKPLITVPSGMSVGAISVPITDLNGGGSETCYTLDGSDPTAASTLYTMPIEIAMASVLKVRAFVPGKLPSEIASASYLVDIDHTTPVISVITENTNLYGATGIFDNWWLDDEKPAHVDYFDTDQQLLFSQNAGMQIDGGNGGSRGFQQHSFRLELDNGVLGDGTVDHALIPDRPERTAYSRFYLRNGSNQYLILPTKDAAQVKAMAGATNSYYSAWRPVSVYINGGYFGLYELREKFDAEYFETLEQADPDSVTLLSQSTWNGGALRPTIGTVDRFWEDMNAFNALDPASPDYWDQVDPYFDLTYYTDYTIGQMWMANIDWPDNNVKIYRSNTTDQRWRFCTIDMEVAMAPNGQTGPTFNGISYLADQDPTIPYSNIWQRSVQNPRFHDHFINRSADVMNSAYRNERILGIAQDIFDLTRPEMGLEFFRWGSSDTTAQLVQYEADNAAFLSELAQRTPIVRDHLQAHFELPRQLDVALNVLPIGAGKIRISTLEPDTYPWEGVYFDGVPVKVEAVANEGWYFSHWTPNTLLGDTLNALFLDTLAADAVLFEAHFTSDLPTAGIGPEKDHTTNMALYPNPATAELFVLNNNVVIGQTNYQVLDMRGQVVQQGVLQAGRKRSSIAITSLASGPYQLSLLGADGMWEMLRFVKL